VNAFSYTRAADVETAVHEVTANGGTKFIAGGTNLIDLMKENVERPNRLIDINRLPLTEIRPGPDGGLRLGALATNTDVAYHPEVERRYPLLAKAILAGASPQLRNMATVGGNLMQRTRCVYFYDTATPCNKREPGTGCSAVAGFNKNHAILGTSEHCIATHPSDMCVALAALEAVVRVTGPGGDRAIPFAEFHRLPGDTPHLDTNLHADEIITAVDLPAKGFAEHHTYLKVRGVQRARGGEGGVAIGSRRREGRRGRVGLPPDARRGIDARGDGDRRGRVGVVALRVDVGRPVGERTAEVGRGRSTLPLPQEETRPQETSAAKERWHRGATHCHRQSPGPIKTPMTCWKGCSRPPTWPLDPTTAEEPPCRTSSPS
jgi:xanthine dehydrogenase YagS FAD-binding subunit